MDPCFVGELCGKKNIYIYTDTYINIHLPFWKTGIHCFVLVFFGAFFFSLADFGSLQMEKLRVCGKVMLALCLLLAWDDQAQILPQCQKGEGGRWSVNCQQDVICVIFWFWQIWFTYLMCIPDPFQTVDPLTTRTCVKQLMDTSNIQHIHVVICIYIYIWINDICRANVELDMITL